MQQRFGALDDFPPELANTIANYCYRWALLTCNAELRVHVVNSANYAEAQGSPAAYRESLQQALQYFPDALAQLRTVRQERGHGDFTSFCTLFVDKYKYNIVNASALRRRIARVFGRIDEIPDLYRTLKSVAVAGEEAPASAVVAA